MPTRRAFLTALATLGFAPDALAARGAAIRAVEVSGVRVPYLVRRAGSGRAPMLLGFGGGDANRGIAAYYDAVYTPEAVYRDHHVILPIGDPGRYFYRYDNAQVRAFLDALRAAEPVAGRGVVTGVSNGGRAALRFAAAAPEAFRAILTMPGALIGDPVPEGWRDYAVLLAHGTEDPRWEAESARAAAALRGRVGALERVALAGQGHVVGPGYDIDPLYARLRAMEARLGR